MQQVLGLFRRIHTPCAVATRNDHDSVVNFFVVCGSLVFAQARGYIGRYCTYTGDGFQEGVSLTAADEVIRLRKYAYGSCEIMLNKFTVSCTRLPGPLARSGMALTGVTVRGEAVQRYVCTAPVPSSSR